MSCPRCGAEIRAGQKFCADCGLALATGCPTCAAPYETGQKFCAECGTDLRVGSSNLRPTGTRTLTNPPSPATTAERRFVSVLFADLVGFTRLSEQHDPEEVRDLLSRYFDLARQIIEGYGGSVEKFIGDAVMAIWGAPVAREDDPERAVRAALDLVARVGELALGTEALAIRAGVLSGEAAVTSGRIGEGMVAGDVVNTASRLQSVAPSNVVLVGESTMQATKASIAYERAGEQLLKGKELPIPAWRALRVVARVGGDKRETGLEPPFVGRDEELRLLKDQLHAAEREQKLRVVAISGQAGLGKSRLVWELEKYLDGLAADRIFYWHQGRSPSYGEGVTYWALGEMIRHRARIAEGEDAASTREKLATTLADFVPDADERRRLEPAVGALLGVDTADWAQREQLFSAWRTFFERVADRGPTVMVFEDLQWADDGLLDFIDHLLDWSRDKPILVITLARPELLERRPNFGLGRRAFVSMHLDPLDQTAMAQLLRGIIPSLDEADLERIVARAEGVPLFAVETVRSLIDGGHLVRRDDVYEPVGSLPTLDVPPTLRALIASRLDALEPTDRALVQDAAVIGVVFSGAALAEVAGRPPPEVESRLRALMTKELVELETDPRSPERGQYRFTQGLMREVAYAGLGRTDRRQRHLAAARYLETLGDDELAGVLSTHYLEAFRVSPEGEEASAIAAQARVALRAAAERARQLHSYSQALSYYEQALAVTFDESDQAQLKLRASDAAFHSADRERAEKYVREVIAWHSGRADIDGEAEGTYRLVMIQLQYSDIAGAKESLTDILARLPDGPTEMTVKLRGQLARVHLFSDEPDLGLRQIDIALEGAEKLVIGVGTLDLLISKAWALMGVRRAREGIALLIGAMHLADDAGMAIAASRARFNLSGMILTDDPHFALTVGRDGLIHDRQEGLTLRAAGFAGNVASALMVLGRFDEVLDLEAETPLVDNPIGIGIHVNAAVVAGMRGDEDGVVARRLVVDRILAASSSQQDVSMRGYLNAMLALARGEIRESRALARETREAYFGGNVAELAVIAGVISIVLNDIEGLRADRVWLHENRGFGAWVERWMRVFDAAITTMAGNAAESAALFRVLIDEWRDANLPLDLAWTTLARAILLPDDPETPAAYEEVRRLFAEMGVTPMFERLMRAIGSAEPASAMGSAVAEPRGSGAPATR